MKNKIFVLTAVHNDLKDTKLFLKSVYSQTFLNYDVYLVDDGSNDGTSSFIKKRYPLVNLIKGNGKWWWTKSLNVGLQKILKIAKKNDYVWIINNDCVFLKETLQILIDFTENHKENIIGSVIVDSKTRNIMESGVRIDWNSMNFQSIELKSPYKIDALPTKGTLYPVSVFKKIGLFDARHFPHYFSDYEFSIRAKRKGYVLTVCSKCEVFNISERTGIEKGKIKNKSFSEIINTLFSKKSKVSLPLLLNIIIYVCPKELRLNCFISLIKKITKNVWTS